MEDSKGAPAYDHPTSPWRNPHILLHKVSQMPPCGCDVDGYGTLPKPVVIKFCKLHAATATLIEAMKGTGEMEAIWRLLNAFASGKTQEQWARVEPLTVLTEVYQNLAIYWTGIQAAIAQVEEKPKAKKKARKA